jgi:hypothetical protein
MPTEAGQWTWPSRKVGLPVRSPHGAHTSTEGYFSWRRRRHDKEDELLTEGMVAVKTYQATVKRWARGWELHIDDIGVTQCRTLGEAEGMVRDYIASDLDVDRDSFDVQIMIKLGEALDNAMQEARDAARKAAEAQEQAADKSRTLARQLSEEGLSGREVATVLGVSPQRVSQLLSANTGRRLTRTAVAGRFGTSKTLAGRTTVKKAGRASSSVKRLAAG